MVAMPRIKGKDASLVNKSQIFSNLREAALCAFSAVCQIPNFDKFVLAIFFNTLI